MKIYEINKIGQYNCSAALSTHKLNNGTKIKVLEVGNKKHPNKKDHVRVVSNNKVIQYAKFGKTQSGKPMFTDIKSDNYIDSCVVVIKIKCGKGTKLHFTGQYRLNKYDNWPGSDLAVGIINTNEERISIIPMNIPFRLAKIGEESYNESIYIFRNGELNCL